MKLTIIGIFYNVAPNINLPGHTPLVQENRRMKRDLCCYFEMFIRSLCSKPPSSIKEFVAQLARNSSIQRISCYSAVGLSPCGGCFAASRRSKQWREILFVGKGKLNYNLNHEQIEMECNIKRMPYKNIDSNKQYYKKREHSTFLMVIELFGKRR